MATATKSKRGRFVFTASEKSARKSTSANLLADVYRASGKVVHFYDADGTNGSLVARQGTRDENKQLLRDQDPAKGCGWYEIAMEGSREKFLDCVEAQPRPDVIFTDTGSKTLDHLKQIIGNGESVSGLVDAIKEAGFDITILHPISPLRISTSSLKNYMNAFGSDADYVAIINKDAGHTLGKLNAPSSDPENQALWGKTDFRFWFGRKNPETGQDEGFKTRDELLANGGKEIVLPMLKDGVFALFEDTNMTFKQAESSKQFTLSERQNIKDFNRAALSAFLEVADVLGLK